MRPLQLWDHGDQVYLVPSNFCNWLSFFAGQWGKLDLLAEFKRGEGMMGGAITGDEEGMEEKKEEDLHPVHLRSPPTFQPWLPYVVVHVNFERSAVSGVR